MIKKSQKINYNVYHKKTSIQTKIINDNNFTYRILLGVINKFLDSPKHILDIGCGAGTLCLYYSNKGYNVLGIDISNKAINVAKESAEFLGLNKAKFKQLNFPNRIPKEKFDFIIFTEVIEHLEDDNLALEKIFLSLKKGGIAVVSTPSQNAPLYKLGLTNKFDKEVGHLRRYELKTLIKKCKKYGFIVLETKKTEGILRNFLFINSIAGKSIRFIKFFLSDLITYIDNISLLLFGESNLIIVVQKPPRKGLKKPVETK